MTARTLALWLLFFLTSGVAAGELPGTAPLDWQGDLSARMLDGAHQYIERQIDASVEKRAAFWRRDHSSPEAYQASVEPNRRRLARILGVVDARTPVVMERYGDDERPAMVAETPHWQAWQVRWSVLDGVNGEGLLLEPKRPPLASVVALPDADQTPEQLAGLAPGIAAESQFARTLADAGMMVLVPALLDRSDEFSGNPMVAMTNQPHREWIYRQAFHMGRHVIGYEVQKVLAGVDWFRRRTGPQVKIGVAGYGEGGLLAFHAAALDPRIDAAWVSGNFGPRQEVWAEPIYRNVWGLLKEFGDAEIASLIAPRGLVVEYSPAPEVTGPPLVRAGRRGGAAGGTLHTPPYDEVKQEFARIDALVGPLPPSRSLLAAENNLPLTMGSAASLRPFAALLGVEFAPGPADGALARNLRQGFDPRARQERTVRQLQGHVQQLVQDSARVREEFFLKQIPLVAEIDRDLKFTTDRVEPRSAEAFAAAARPYKDLLWDEVLGRLEAPLADLHPRGRQIYDKPAWIGYEVVLDVWPEVFAWGVLLVPKDIKPGERRPVVVCQHGRNGLPTDVIEGDNGAYHDFAARLAERGFVTFAPHNLYRGEDRYRWLDRKANSIGASMFSVILAQHQQILAWLGELPFVDRERIGFYGLSYGGESAVRLPPLLDGYALSICSADFNDWTRKVASTDSRYSFMFTVEWEMPYFNMGQTFSYAELSALMIPRPFMVERGHHDRVAPDPWVASEYAKVRWLYAQLGLADKTEIEFFNGGHTIHGQGTFAFLHRHLHWPEPKGQSNHPADD